MYNMFSVSAIHCYVGEAGEAIDCDTIGMQREELYCRNVTTINNNNNNNNRVERSCVAMSWFDASWEELGCHKSGNVIRCTCAKDYCNGPEKLNSLRNTNYATKTEIPTGFFLSLRRCNYA